MVRHYKRKSNRGHYGDEALVNALKFLEDGGSVRGAARRFNVPPRTLRRHRDNKVLVPGKSVLGRMSVLPREFEEELVTHIQNMERALFGLTALDVRQLAYDLAQKSTFFHPFNTETKLAGIEWFHGFMSRNPELSIRKPQATSIMRAVGFNKVKTDQFYHVYGEVLETLQNASPNRIWNVDETGIQNVQAPCRIVATKGVSQVAKITSGERGFNVTVVCSMNATGNYVPPMMIFPRKRFNEQLIRGAPNGTIGRVSTSGWIDSELFVDWLKHFIVFSGCTKEQKHILILDGHHSHKTLQAVELARDNGVIMITLPPHCSHKMQPLDRTFFKSFKSAFNRQTDSWMSEHPGRRVTVYEVAEIFGVAYSKTATIDRAIKGFHTTGIWPFNKDRFTDDDFRGANVTDQPETNVEPLTTVGQSAVLTTFETTSTSTSTRPPTAPSTSTRPSTAPSTSTRPPTTPSTSTRPPTAPSTSTRPPTAPSTSSRPPTAPSTSTRPPTAPSTFLRPPAGPLTYSRPPTASSTSTRPPTAPSTSTRPPTVLSSSSKPSTAPLTYSRPSTAPSTSTRPPIAPSTSSRPPTAPSTSSRPPSVAPTSTRPPTAPSTFSRPPTASSTSTRPPTAPSTSSRPPTAPSTSTRPPTVASTSTRPPTAVLTSSRPPTAPSTSSRPPTAPSTSNRPPTAPSASSRLPPASSTSTRPPTVPSISSRPPTAPSTSNRPPTAPSASSRLPPASSTSTRPPTAPSTRPPTLASTSSRPTTEIVPRSSFDNSLLARRSYCQNNLSKHRARIILSDISPQPKVKTQAPRKRKAESSTVLTSSPNCNLLKEKHQLKTDKELGSKMRKLSKKPKQKGVKEVQNEEENDADCIYCSEWYSQTGGNWIRCEACHGWAHVDCADAVNDVNFTCDFCDVES